MDAAAQTSLMGAQAAQAQSVQALYPPTVEPAARPVPLYRNLLTFTQNPLRTLPRSVYTESAVSVENAGRSLLWLMDPDGIEDVLVTRASEFRRSPVEKRVFGSLLGDGVLTAEGAQWRWQRRALAPLFRHSELVGYVPKFAEAAHEQLSVWRGRRAFAPIDVDVAMTDLTFAVIARTMLSGGEPAESAAIKRAGSAYLGHVSWEVAYGLLDLPAWLPHPGSLVMRRARLDLRSSMLAIIERRRAQGLEAGAEDLLGRLMSAREPETGKPMSNEALINNLATLLEAGHETTAKALTWALYLLARSPQWQDQVRVEALAAGAGGTGAKLDVDKLPQTEKVVREAMRLYPPVPFLLRMATAPMTIAGRPVKAGTMINIPIFAIHRHTRLWSDPARFDPERFTPEAMAGFKRGQYMPFGAGPRICIGGAFAMLEAKSLLATLVAGARFHWDGKHVPEPISRVTLRPKGGMPLGVEMLA